MNLFLYQQWLVQRCENDPAALFSCSGIIFHYCKGKPFYFQREFASFIVAGVYIPLQANVQDMQRMLTDQILYMEQTYPDKLLSLVTLTKDTSTTNFPNIVYEMYGQREECFGSPLHHSQQCLSCNWTGPV